MRCTKTAQLKTKNMDFRHVTCYTRSKKEERFTGGTMAEEIGSKGASMVEDALLEMLDKAVNVSMHPDTGDHPKNCVNLRRGVE